MELHQISYFINLAATLNFTAAARLSGVSQPSLTRAIRKLEVELGGALIHREGKNSRLTGLGQDVELEFKRMLAAIQNVRHHSEHWGSGKHRVLHVAVAPTVGPKAFTPFFLNALDKVPSIEIKLHTLASREGAKEILSGKYHAYIQPRESRQDLTLNVHPLFRERFVLGCAADHPLAKSDVVCHQDLKKFPYIDRMRCEFREQIHEYLAQRDVVIKPRFRTDREHWVQLVVADGHAVCILPERSASAPGLVTRPIDGLILERELVLATVSGSATPDEMHEVARLAEEYSWE